MEDYPQTLSDFDTRFVSEDACWEYLVQLRWSNGFVCPRYAGKKDYYLDEYTFRFNRRTSRHCGKLFYRVVQQALAIEVTPYKTFVKHVRGVDLRTTRCSGYLSELNTPNINIYRI